MNDDSMACGPFRFLNVQMIASKKASEEEFVQWLEEAYEG